MPVNETSPPKYLQDDEINQECKDLLPSLPKERGWISTHLHNYQGYWYAPEQLQGVITCQKHFEAQDSDILLVTNPKSGTTWLKAIAFALVNRGRYNVSTPQHPLSSKNPHDLVPFLHLKVHVENANPDFSSFSGPRLFATHLPFVSLPHSVQASACKLVYLCRNPKDTFVSLWHFTNTLRLQKNMGTNPLEDVFDLFCRGISPHGPFWDHVLGYWVKSLELPHKILFLKYEELKQQPIVHLRKLAEFLDCPFSVEEEESGILDEILKLCSFDNLSNLEVNRNGKLSSGVENKVFFRRGEVGDWKNFLTGEMIDRLDCVAEPKFQAFGLQL